MRKSTIFFLTIFFSTASLHASLFINEFMAVNVLAYADSEGEYEDWIEIHNSGNSPVDLAGYYLTDDISDPNPFRVPSGHASETTIPAKGFLVLYASGSPERGARHLGFKLSQSGEMIALLRPDGVTVEDSLTYENQMRDISFGRFADGTGLWQYMDGPTPGSANQAGYAGVCPEPVILTASGFYDGGVDVSVQPGRTGDIVRYTLDCEDPDASSPEATGPIHIGKTAVFKAREFRAGDMPGPIATRTFFVDDDRSLAVVSLATDPDNLYDPETGIYIDPDETDAGHDGRAWERPAFLEFFPDRTLGFQIPGGIRTQGNSSPDDYAKQSYSMHFRQGYGAPQLDFRLFEKDAVASFQSLVLRAGYDDGMDPGEDNNRVGTLVRDPAVTELWRRTGYPVSQGRFASLYLAGEYNGIYEIRERIDEHFFMDHLGYADLDLMRTRWDSTELVYGSRTEWRSLVRFFEDNTFADDAMLAEAEKLMDLDNYATLHALAHATAYYSWAYGAFMCREKKDNARWGWTIWDADRTFLTSRLDDNLLTTTEAKIMTYLRNTFTNKLLQNASYRNRYINRTADILNSLCSPAQVKALIDSLAGIVADEIPADVTRWNSSVERWNENLDAVKSFADQRPDIVRQQFIDYFQLGGAARLSLAIGQGEGSIRVNTVNVRDFPWSGIYFQGVPITLTAIPDAGYRFAGWTDASLPGSETVSLSLADDLTVTALFQPLAETNCELVTPSRMPSGQRLPIVARIRDAQWQFDPRENSPLHVRFGGARSDTTLPLKRCAGVMAVPIPSGSDFTLSLESATVPLTEKNIQVSDKPVQTYTGALSTGDVIWDASSDRRINGILTVPAGCRLVIQPGTWVIFDDLAGMTVFGEIEAEGTENDPVVFTASAWDAPWGGIEMKGAEALFRYCFFLDAGGDFSKGWAHTNRQPILFAREQSRLQIENGFFLFSPGKAVCAEDSRVRMTESVTAFVYHGGELSRAPFFFQDNYVMNIPDDDNSTYTEDIDTDGYHINDVDPLHPEYSVIDRCFFITGKDDAIDQMSARLKITNCWLEDWVHEGVAASSGDTVRIFNTVSIHNDQGFEAGWTDDGVTRGPFVFIDHCVAAYNNTGLRIGDSYDWTYHDFMRVTNSIVYGNTDNIRNYLNSTQAPLEGGLEISYSMTNDPDYDASPHCISGIPVFDETFYLQPGSPGAGMGESGADMGRADSTAIRASALVINEIMYNAPQDKDSGDWIELFNPGSRMQNLSGWQVRDASDAHVFEFPSGTVIPGGGYLSLCQDTTAFKAAYPGSVRLAGNVPFGFGRNDQVRLFAPSGANVDSVAYESGGAWPGEADGQGCSLELIDVWKDNASSENWAKSALYGGSPGRKNGNPSTDTTREPVLPKQFLLEQNYPNPFNPTTRIGYALPREGIVRLVVYDLLGRRVLDPVEDKRQPAGMYRIDLDGRTLASGVYFYRIAIQYSDGSRDVRTRKMVVMK